MEFVIRKWVVDVDTKVPSVNVNEDEDMIEEDVKMPIFQWVCFGLSF